MDQNPKQQVVERLRQANNVLVTVSNNPSVDQLAACIGLTLMLNKLGKHATAVFSGKIPSTLEFLQPEKTLEPNTDSLRDFIISLDKSKADKLRYKVEDNLVRIFITPYRTSITDKDLDFTQGDFNVDAVMALGVSSRTDIDQAIVAHGRILHDATVISASAGQQTSDVGAINWQEPTASSLSEMIVSISESFQSGLIDAQMATAFLTGIVAETERFRNTKTSPKVMTMSAQLMAAGANQQLIASKLEVSQPVAQITPVNDEAKSTVGASAIPGGSTSEQSSTAKDTTELEIPHEEQKADEPAELPVPTDLQDDADLDGKLDQIHIDDSGNLSKLGEAKIDHNQPSSSGALLPPSQANNRPLVSQPPVLGGALTANTLPEDNVKDGVGDPLTTSLPSLPSAETSGLVGPQKTLQPLTEEANQPTNTTPPSIPALEPINDLDTSNQTLESIEAAVESPHLAGVPGSSEASNVADILSSQSSSDTLVDQARAAVEQANQAKAPDRLEPIQALGAQPVDLGLNQPAPDNDAVAGPLQDLSDPTIQKAPEVIDPNSPPPVPPPLPLGSDNPFLNPTDSTS
jgi:hypothetical protein